MAERLLKNEYKTPRACVRGVFLEGAIADSAYPAIGHGNVQYTPYPATATEDERDVELF
jgi:hypothetical protein